MATAWYHLLLTSSLIWLLLAAQCRLQSGDSTSGVSVDDSDDDQNLANQTTQIAAPYITKNSSDFHYADFARDDHEVIVNKRRLKNKKLRSTSRKTCLEKCKRSRKCFQQMEKGLMKGEHCNICIAQCATHTPQPGR